VLHVIAFFEMMMLHIYKNNALLIQFHGLLSATVLDTQTFMHCVTLWNFFNVERHNSPH
jgi:hypothetical protein